MGILHHCGRGPQPSGNRAAIRFPSGQTFRAAAKEVAGVVLVALAVMATPAFAQECGQVEPFISTHNPETLPDRPDDTGSNDRIRAYVASLETFRATELEGYNDDLNAFVRELGRIDKAARIAVVKEKCSPEAYVELRDLINEEYVKAGDDYLAAYWRGWEVFKKAQKWASEQKDVNIRKAQLGV